MNLAKMFEAQAAFDSAVVEAKGLQGVDLLPRKILSLQVELGELANEERSWKFWSEDRKPRIEVPCKNCNGSAVCYPFIGTENSEVEEVCENCQGTGTENLLLEEYVDCLKFILSIGLEKSFDKVEFEYLHESNFAVYTEANIVKQFNNTFSAISEFAINDEVESYEDIFLYFIGLGKHMGFTWNQIWQAYFEKEKVNYERLASGY